MADTPMTGDADGQIGSTRQIGALPCPPASAPEVVPRVFQIHALAGLDLLLPGDAVDAVEVAPPVRPVPPSPPGWLVAAAVGHVTGILQHVYRLEFSVLACLGDAAKDVAHDLQ